MSDFLASYYLWIKSLHIMAVISWMAGLFYLPRLFVYHTEQTTFNDKMDITFQVMEYKLFRYIMTPAMTVTWICGILLLSTPGIVDWSMTWPWLKAICVVLMTWFHHWLSWRIKEFAIGKNSLSGRQYRLANEVPTILMLLIVLSVVVKF